MYIEEFKQVIINLKERKSYDNQVLRSTKSDNEDWNTFRHFIKIIQIVGELLVKQENLEEIFEKQIQNNFIYKSRVSSGVNKTTQYETNSLNLQYSLLSINNLKECFLQETDIFKLNTLISVVETG